MKTKYPKSLLIAFENITPPNPVDFSTSLRDMAYQYKNRSYKIKRYHLHPGNEVKKVRCELARALNIIRGDVWYYNLNTTDKDVAEDLRNNGVPIRWDAKKGRFV